MRLTLLIPDLLWPEPEDDLAYGPLPQATVPALETLLARGQLERRPGRAPEALLAPLFGLEPEAPPALAALRLLGEERSDSDLAIEHQLWLCADPTHVRLHQDQMILADAGSFDLSQEEARDLAAALSQHFAGEAHFHVADARRWYVRLTTDWAADLPLDVTQPLSAVAGRRLELPSPRQPAAARLRALLNEAQMVLHAHPANTAREERGLPPVNSLWLWGPGKLPIPLKSPLVGLWSDDPLARGLARAAGVPDRPLPANAAALLKESAAAPTGSQLLVHLPQLQGPARYQEPEAWHQALLSLEQEWFAPLLAALGRGQITELTLAASGSYGLLTWHLRSLDRWKLWRRPQALQALARQLSTTPNN